MSGIVEARCAAAVVWSSPAGRPMHSRSSALEDVLAYDTTFLERYLLGQGIFASREEAQAAMVACKTFLWHAAQCPIIDVESDRVDAAWHAWLLHTEQYMRFCFEGTGSVSCNSVFVLHLCRFLNQEELMERKAMVQNP
jgi:hypothetical protein